MNITTCGCTAVDELLLLATAVMIIKYPLPCSHWRLFGASLSSVVGMGDTVI